MSENSPGPTESPVSSSKRFLSPLRLLRRNEGGLILAILVVIAVTTLLDSQHAYWNDPWPSAKNVLRQAAMLGIFALGAAIVIISGGIDLSCGSVIAFSGSFC